MCCSLYPSWSPPRFSFYIWILLYWLHICLQCLSWWISPFSVMNYPSVSLFMAFVLKSILSDISIATLAFFPVHLSGTLFSNPSLSVCVGLLFWGGSLVGSICAGHVFLSIQLLYVFWLEHLIYLHLRSLLIGTYSRPFFPLFLSLSLSIALKQSL